MLFHVAMEVRLPPDLDPGLAERLVARERARAEELQRSGQWRHLWRVAGRYANVSVFDVESPAELHELVSTLPLFPYMTITVTALCRHPSSINPDDR
jgi:muconolactone D-isomerase